LILYSWSFYYAYCKISYIPFLPLTPSPRLTSQHLRLRHHPNQWRILALSLVIPRTISCIQKELWIILLDARSTFSPSIHISPLSIPTNIKFTTAQLLVKSLFVTSTTTKMNRAGTVVSSRGSIIYTGSIIVLDEQPSVYLIFGTTLTIICPTQRVNKYYATEGTEYFKAKVIAFYRQCQLHIFCNFIQLKYVGTSTYDSQKILADISIPLSSIKVKYQHK